MTRPSGLPSAKTSWVAVPLRLQPSKPRGRPAARRGWPAAAAASRAERVAASAESAAADRPGSAGAPVKAGPRGRAAASRAPVRVELRTRRSQHRRGSSPRAARQLRRNGRAVPRPPRGRRPYRHTSAAALRAHREWRRRGSWPDDRMVRGTGEASKSVVEPTERRCGVVKGFRSNRSGAEAAGRPEGRRTDASPNPKRRRRGDPTPA